MVCLDANLSPIGFGAFKIGRNQNVKYPQGYDLPDDAAVNSLLNGVLDAGINYIDTAPAYGLSEQRIGQAISHRRGEYVLSTKVGENFDNGVSTFDFSQRAVKSSVEQSLRHLKADSLDLVFVHANRPDIDVLNNTDVVPALLQLRDQGQIRAAGFSGYSDQAIRQSLTWADAIMVEYHLEDAALEPVMHEAAQAGAAVIVKKGLAAGRLPPEGAIRFVLSNPSVASMVIGGLNLEHIRNNVQIARSMRSFDPLKGSKP